MPINQKRHPSFLGVRLDLAYSAVTDIAIIAGVTIENDLMEIVSL